MAFRLVPSAQMRPKFAIQFIVSLLPLCVAVLVTGCGREPLGLTVHGRVTYQEQPVEEGTLTFYPSDGQQGPPKSAIIENGAYAFQPTEGLVAGIYRVEIEGYRKTGRKIPDMVSPLSPNEQRSMIDERLPFLPEQYNEQSNLTADISESNLELNFDLPK